MSETYLEPARTVIHKLGGVHAVAHITGKSVSRVYRWMKPEAQGGTDGMIPNREAVKLLAHARGNRIKLSPADFFPKIEAVSAAERQRGAAESEVAA